MKCNRVIVLLAGLALTIGLSAPAFAGPSDPTCEGAGIEIEVNALRGGSPTVASNGTKDITAKARIRKGLAAPDATLTGTTLTITSYDVDPSTGEESVYDVQQSLDLTLVVGKGGQGDKLTMGVPPCDPGDTVFFTAHFEGEAPNGAICAGLSDRLFKTCK